MFLDDASSAVYVATLNRAAAIDIKPASDRNLIHPRRPGFVRVALLGSDDFDVGEIDPSSLTFGPDGAAPLPLRRFRDANGDGFTDFVTRYPTKQTGIEIGDIEACLGGELADGTPFEGCDRIETMPQDRPRDCAR